MAERDGYKTIETVAEELGIPEERIRTAIIILKIQPFFFPDDRRRRFYSPEDVKRIKEILNL